MPAKIIADDTRVRLAQSMPLVERSRARIKRRIGEHVRPPAKSADDLDAPGLAAMLLELLIDGASDIAAFGELRDLSRIQRRHRQFGISEQHYSSFGLALGPALRVVLGPAMSPKSASAWCDAFRCIVAAVGGEHCPDRRTVGIRLSPAGPMLRAR